MRKTSWIPILIVLIAFGAAFANSCRDNIIPLDNDKVSINATLTGSQYMTFESHTKTDYQVPTNKTLKVTSVHWAGAADSWIAIGYGDSSVAAGSTSPDAALVIIGATSTQSVISSRQANEPYSQTIYFEIPGDKYPFAYASATTSIQLVGYAK